MGCKLYLRMFGCVRPIVAMPTMRGMSTVPAMSTTTTLGTRFASLRLSYIEHYGWHVMPVASKTLDKELKSLPKG